MNIFEACDNLSAVLYKKDDIRMEQKPLPEIPKENEVILQTQDVGICSSDVSYWLKGYIGDFIVKKPMILGHETSAKVVKIGPGVDHIKPGDLVTVEPGVPCRRCRDCREGRYNLCKNIFFLSTPPHDGSLTRYFKHAADFCYKLPDNVSSEEGALIEPLSVAFYACSRANLNAGNDVLICGAGPIGLLILLTARELRCGKICVTDIDEKRLKFAKSLGADFTVKINPEESEEMTLNKVIECFDNRPDITMECSGAESSTRLALLATRDGGKVLLIGLGPTNIRVPLINAAVREVDILGVFRYRHCYPKAISLLSRNILDIKQLITHRYSLEQTVEAFEMARSGKGIKIMINCGLK